MAVPCVWTKKGAEFFRVFQSMGFRYEPLASRIETGDFACARRLRIDFLKAKEG